MRGVDIPKESIASSIMVLSESSDSGEFKGNLVQTVMTGVRKGRKNETYGRLLTGDTLIEEGFQVEKFLR